MRGGRALLLLWAVSLALAAGFTGNAAARSHRPVDATAPDRIAKYDRVAVADLPREARATLAQIHQGGPFAHPQDGGVFGNRERVLPSQPRGYYHEYTVETPGAHNRGARRIIAGGNPPQEYFYTDDHYRSFRRIAE